MRLKGRNVISFRCSFSSFTASTRLSRLSRQLPSVSSMYISLVTCEGTCARVMWGVGVMCKDEIERAKCHIHALTTVPLVLFDCDSVFRRIGATKPRLHPSPPLVPRLNPVPATSQPSNRRHKTSSSPLSAGRTSSQPRPRYFATLAYYYTAIAEPSLRHHFAIAMQSLRNHIAIAAQSLGQRYAIAAESF